MASRLVRSAARRAISMNGRSRYVSSIAVRSEAVTRGRTDRSLGPSGGNTVSSCT